MNPHNLFNVIFSQTRHPSDGTHSQKGGIFVPTVSHFFVHPSVFSFPFNIHPHNFTLCLSAGTNSGPAEPPSRVIPPVIPDQKRTTPRQNSNTNWRPELPQRPSSTTLSPGIYITHISSFIPQLEKHFMKFSAKACYSER